MATAPEDFETVKKECDVTARDGAAPGGVEDPQFEPPINAEPSDDTALAEPSGFPEATADPTLNERPETEADGAPEDVGDPLSGLIIKTEPTDDTEITDTSIGLFPVVGGSTVQIEVKTDDEMRLLIGDNRNPRAKNIPCNVCGRRFSSVAALEMHMIAHTGAKPVVPSSDPSQLRFTDVERHQANHTRKKPYVCEICGCTFCRIDMLKGHKKFHTEERPYHCDACDAKFLDACSLRKHKWIHSGEMRYFCNYCNFKFSDTDSLSRHKSTHKGVKPYACDSCACRFSTRWFLKRHRMKTHDVK